MLRVLRLLLCALCSTAFLSAFQPYLPFSPAPQPELALGASTTSPFYVDTSVSIYNKQAFDCFLDELATRHQLSALYFNSDDFRLSTIFQDCLAATNTQNYNPYMRVLRFKPQVTFSETGTLLSVRTQAALGKDAWLRVGFSASIPLIRRSIERIDKGTRGRADTQNLVSQAEIMIEGSDTSIPYARAYRLDFVEALPYDANFTPSIAYDTDSAGETTIFGRAINAVDDSIGGALVIRAEDDIPRNEGIGIADTPLGSDGTQINSYLPTRIENESIGSVYEVPTGTDYTGLLDSSDKTVKQRIADQDAKAKAWLIGTYNSGASTDNFNDIDTAMTEKIAQYQENVYEWFYDRKHLLESQRLDGIGDLRAEAYIACNLTQAFQLKLVAGASLPTARQATTGQSPYAIHLGNRGHIESYIGAHTTLAIPHTSCFLTSYMRYTTALPAIEIISATPRGAQIKNMGPSTRAEISWHSAQGDVWLHLTHPYQPALRCSIGYDWHAKIEDSLSFVDSAPQSYLGALFNSSTRKYDIANPLILDAEVAKLHTGMVRHTLKVATHYELSQYVKLSGQIGYVLGGRNCPQELECGLSCNVSY